LNVKNLIVEIIWYAQNCHNLIEIDCTVQRIHHDGGAYLNANVMCMCVKAGPASLKTHCVNILGNIL
jgi:hypothetical protein